jgi:hypothetical protein
VKLNQPIWPFLLLLLACQSREVRPKVTGTEYFPLKTGGYWIYDVLETQIAQVGGQISVKYDLKMEIIDSLSSSDGVTYVIQRLKRADALQPWISIDTWSARRDQFQAVMQEGNVPYVRLLFPLAEGKTWDGNALNNQGGTDRCADGSIHCDSYEVTDLSKRFETTGISFEDTVTILENNEVDPIVKQDVRKSVYAKSIGMVYHEIDLLEYCTVGDCIGKQVVENGVILKQTLKAYGGL